MSQKKESILRTVLTMMSASEGKKAITISNIAKEMDMGKSTLYEYFDSKEDMIKQAMFLMIQENENYIIENNLPEEKGFKNAFLNHMRRSIEIAKRNQMTDDIMNHVEWIKVSRQYKDEIMERILEFYHKSKNHMEIIIKQGIIENKLNPKKIENQKEVIESLIVGAIITFANPLNRYNVHEDLEKIFDTLVDLCH